MTTHRQATAEIASRARRIASSDRVSPDRFAPSRLEQPGTAKGHDAGRARTSQKRGPSKQRPHPDCRVGLKGNGLKALWGSAGKHNKRAPDYCSTPTVSQEPICITENRAGQSDSFSERARERKRERTFRRLHLREVGSTQGAEHEEAGLGQPVAVVLDGKVRDRSLLRLLGRAEQRGSLVSPHKADTENERKPAKSRESGQTV